MKSTGEVMGVASSFGEAFAKAQLSAGQILPTGGTVFFTVNDHDKQAAIPLARRYVDLGFKIVATEGTANVLEGAGLIVERVFKVEEGRPNAVDLIKGDRIQLVVNTPRGQDALFDEKAIRRAAVTRANSHHHHDCGRAGRRRGHCRNAETQRDGLRTSGAAYGQRAINKPVLLPAGAKTAPSFVQVIPFLYSTDTTSSVESFATRLEPQRAVHCHLSGGFFPRPANSATRSKESRAYFPSLWKNPVKLVNTRINSRSAWNIFPKMYMKSYCTPERDRLKMRDFSRQ